MNIVQKKIAAKLGYHVGTGMGLLAKLIHKTLDFELEVAEEHYKNPQQQVIYGIWHNRIVISITSYLAFISQIKSDKKLYALTSASRDGELIAGLMSVVGVQTIRGSSHKNARAAALEIYKTIKSGKDISITPDGPKGPLYELKPGLIQIAAKTQVPILPIKIEYRDYWELNTWDKLQIPKPFSKVKVTYGALQWVPSDYDNEFESAKLIDNLGR